MALAKYESKWLFKIMKYIFDLLLGIAIFVLLAAPLLLVAIAVRLTSKGPSLYWSDRVGKNNKFFDDFIISIK